MKYKQKIFEWDDYSILQEYIPGMVGKGTCRCFNLKNNLDFYFISAYLTFDSFFYGIQIEKNMNIRNKIKYLNM